MRLSIDAMIPVKQESTTDDYDATFYGKNNVMAVHN